MTVTTIDTKSLDFAKAPAPKLDLESPLTPTELLHQALSMGLHPRVSHLAYTFGLFQSGGRDVGIGKTRGYHGATKKALEDAAKRGQPVDQSVVQYHRNCVNTASIVQNWAKSVTADKDIAAQMQAKIADRIGEPYLPIQREFWAPPVQYRITGTYDVTAADAARAAAASESRKLEPGTYLVTCDVGAYSPKGAVVRMSAALFPRAWKLWPDLNNLTIEVLDEIRDNTISITKA